MNIISSMKPKNFLLTLLLTISAACSSHDTTYTVASGPEDSSTLAAKRVTIKIFIPEGRSRQDVIATLERAARELSDKTNADAAMVFAYRSGDPTDGIFTVGKAVYAPGGKWERATSNEGKSIVTELGAIYFSPAKKQPTISEVVTLRSSSLDHVSISNEYERWTDENIIAKVDNGSKAKILEIRKEAMGDQEFARFRVRTTTGTPTEGWVHSFDAGYQ